MISLILPHVNTIAMNIFLKEVSRRQADRFTLMFMDKVGWHTANVLEDRLEIELREMKQNTQLLQLMTGFGWIVDIK